MASHIDDVINPAENAEIAVRGQYSSIRRKIRPVTPILAVGVLAVFFVVLADEAVAIPPDGLHDSRPGIADTDIPCFVRSGRNLLAIFVNNRWINPGHAGARASRLHGINGRFGAAEEASVFGLPPGIDNHRLT